MYLKFKGKKQIFTKKAVFKKSKIQHFIYFVKIFVHLDASHLPANKSANNLMAKCSNNIKIT